MLTEIVTVLICCFSQTDFDHQIKSLPPEAYDIQVVSGCPIGDGHISIYYKVDHIASAD